MKHIVRTYVLTLAVALSFSQAPAWALEPADSAETKKYVHPQLGWSIELRKDWVLGKQSMKYVEFGSPKGHPWARVSVRVFGVTPKAGPLGSFTRMARASFRRKME